MIELGGSPSKVCLLEADSNVKTSDVRLALMLAQEHHTELLAKWRELHES